MNFLQIDKCESLCKEFYSGPSRSLLVYISMSTIEDRYGKNLERLVFLWCLELGYIEEIVLNLL